jgi:hypothetical protein
VKQDPRLTTAERNMAPGEISRTGFLGSDPRRLIDILIDDGQLVNSLGLTHSMLASAMERLTEHGRQAFGNPVLADGFLEVTVEDSRGNIACPFGHNGMYPKENVTVKNIKTGESICWTALNIHLIKEHGFYEGKGSPFRVEPEAVARVLGLKTL